MLFKKKKPKFDNIEQELIDYIKNLKFKHHAIGIDEKEVWIVVSNIQKFYARKNLENEIKLKALIEERDEEIEKLRKEIQNNGIIQQEEKDESQRD